MKGVVTVGGSFLEKFTFSFRINVLFGSLERKESRGEESSREKSRGEMEN